MKQPTGKEPTLIDVDKEEPIKVLIYGKAGTGKTTLASTFPKPALLIDVKENGYISVKKVKGLKVTKVETFADLEDIYWYLSDNPGEYKTVILDGLSGIQDVAIMDLIEARNKKINLEQARKWGVLKRTDWGEISSKVKPLMVSFRDLPMNVVYIAHEKVENGSEEDSEEQLDPVVGPKVMASVGSTVCASVDFILNTFIREKRDEKGKNPQIKYAVRIGPNPYYITKARLPRDMNCPPFMVDVCYEDLIDLLDQETIGF